MDEFKINNIEKINTINFINYSDIKSSQKPSYTIKKIPNIDYSNPSNNAENSKIKKKNSQKGLSNKLSINSRYNNNDNNNAMLDEGIAQNNKPHYIYNASKKINLPFPINTISFNKPRNKNILTTTEKQNSKSKYSFRKTVEPEYTNFTFNYSDANIDRSNNTQSNNQESGNTYHAPSWTI